MKIHREIWIISLYFILLGLIVTILNFSFFPGLLDSRNFLYADAGHYFWIKKYGYEGFRVAFFPLFPLIWNGLSIGIYSIALFNALLFLSTFYLLIRTLEVSPLETLIYLSIPSFIFFYLPFSESVFFATSTLLLIGLKNDKWYLIISGLFLSTLARPAFTIFIPALLISELMSEKINNKTFLRLGIYLSVVAAGIVLVGIIQYYYTAVWFKFFDAQKEWGNKLQIPKLPLSSWTGGLITRLDAAAMLFGICAGIVLLLKMIKEKFIKNIIIPKEVAFSLAYLAGITLLVLIFRGGSLFSLNRFVFAVPFIIIALNFYFGLKLKLEVNHFILGIILMIAFFLLFGSYQHIQSMLKYLLLSLYILLILIIKSKNEFNSVTATCLLIGLNIFFQIFFFIRFLNGGWIG